jgi:NAD(P)-dependent dehydrogenase (short-subunit alcohol dehydrogenase family)
MEADSNCVVIITGASRGLGLGLACLLCAQKVPLVLTARSLPAVARVAANLGRHAPVEAAAADAADEAAMQKVFEAADRLGPLQGVVNNAGLLEPIGAMQAIDVAAFEANLRTNVTGVLVGIRLGLRHRKPGLPLRILSLSSGAASHAYAGWAAYCASKAAVNMLTEVAAAEQSAEAGISVLAVAPGIIETAMQRTIRAASFPEQRKFIELKESGALLHPVKAAVALDWLVRYSPMHYSGRMVDARDGEVSEAAEKHGRSMGSALDRAMQWFGELEP